MSHTGWIERAVLERGLNTHTSPAGSEPAVPDADQLVAELRAVYREHGFQAGYNRAVRDQLATLVYTAEQFLRERGDTAQADRQLVYRFVLALERQIARLSPSRLDADDTFGDLGAGI
jgi:hypothetical protein